MRRALLLLLLLPIPAGIAAFVARGQVIDHFAERARTKAQARLGWPVHLARVATHGLFEARAYGVRVGPSAAPVVIVPEVRAHLAPEAVRRGSARPRLVELLGPVVFVRGDGSLRGAVEALRALKPPGLAERGAEGGGASGGGGLPEVLVVEGRVVDLGGALAAHGIEVTLSDGRLTGHAEVERPALGRCDFEGDLTAIEVRCAQAFARSLPGGLRIAASSVRLERAPVPRLRVPEVRVTAEDRDSRVGRLLGGLSADLSVALERDRAGRWPIEASLVLPGGGRIVGRGLADASTVDLSAQAKALQLARVHRAVSGSLSGSYRLRADRRARTVELVGSGSLAGVMVEHEALADGPVGPFDAELRARVDLALGEPPSRGTLKLSDASVTLGEVKLSLEASVDTTGEAPVVEARAYTDRIDGARLADAVPEGLLPNLQPLALSGPFAFEGRLKIDWAALKQTVLDVDLDIRKLRVDSISPHIDLEALGETFETRFEMPDGDIIARTTGPASPRWTPLEGLPALLPAAVVTQEDGGFYRHKGVSMLHLRGSLIRNLERSRFARGGSTLTMQLARNLFLNRRKTLARKLEELVLSWQLERNLSKDEMMALYLNVVEFGPEVFGVGDAARYYFDRPPWALTPEEVVFLVRLLPSPRRYHKQFEKGKLSASYARSMQRLLDLLVDRGHLVPGDYDPARVPERWAEMEDRP